MEIPLNIQEKLKCSECDDLLSCGPVYSLHETGDAICGRCSQQPEENDSTENNNRTRNEPYEATASLLVFPCAFAARGCREKIKFSLGQSSHELNCKYRPLICPIAPRGSCDWIGPWLELKEHCDEKHRLNVLENPCNPPRPDLTTSNLQTYLISAFRFLFLLQIKVCVTSGKLFHSVWMFGDQDFLERFSFNLEIERNDIKMINSGSVLRAGILTIQEPTAICTTINSLLDMLDGKYNESVFTIRIEAFFKYCVNCLKHIENDFYAKFCKKCEGELYKCDYYGNDCSYVDVNYNKCEKHNTYFCPLSTFCCFCEDTFDSGELLEHLESSHKTIKSGIGSVVRVTLNHEFVIFLSNNIGPVICEYYLSEKLCIYLYTTLPFYELKNIKCSIKLIDPQTKHTSLLTPQIEYGDGDLKCHDWSIKEEINNFPSLGNIGIDIKINIDKK